MRNPFFHTLCLWLLFACLLFSGLARAEWDSSRYISVDEIQPGMEAWCLTVLEGTKVQKFPLKVLSIVRNAEPGRNFILVMGTDEVFKHYGSIQGCSGSPVYIEGRLAGALASGWSQAVDPLYLVRPIKDMLEVEASAETTKPAAFTAEVSDLLDPESADRRYLEYLKKNLSSRRMILPLAVSVPEAALDSVRPMLQALGMQPVAGSGQGFASGDSPNPEQMHIIPGGVLAVPLCFGDISLAGVGTATEVVGDKVFGFGHSMLGYGAIDLPMSAGTVHTTVANRSISFKFASTGPVLGSLTIDRATGVLGQIGKEPPLIPMTIHVERQDVPEVRDFHCQLAINELLTPLIARVALQGASEVFGGFPPEHSVEYEVNMQLDGHDPIHFSNVSTDSELAEASSETAAVMSLLMNNPYQAVAVKQIDVSFRMEPRSRQAEIWSVDLSDTTLKPGQWVTANVILQSYRSEKTVQAVRLQIPADLKPGQYVLQILSFSEYLGFQRKAAPYRFAAEDLPSMLGAVRRILHTRRNQLVAILLLPPGGIAIRNQELPDLPASRAILFQDDRRYVPAVVMQHWIQTETPMDMVPSGNITVQLTVEP